MRVAIMQPYLFPYLGYFQLMHRADIFVVLDDVTYIKQGWINRNRLLMNGAEYQFTIPLAGSSSNKLIKDTRLHPNTRPRRKLLAAIAQAYCSAPKFKRVYELIEHVLLTPQDDLTSIVCRSFELINQYVGLPVVVRLSSTVDKNPQLVAQERVIELCKLLQANEYINPLGGAALYAAADFARAGLSLRFLQPELQPYGQVGSTNFVAGLSIIDVLMHNEPRQARKLFQQGTLHP